MKKISILTGLIIFCITLTGIIWSSSMVEYYCEYKNDHITLSLANRFSSWLYRSNGRTVDGSSQSVTFKMKANPGYKIINSAEVKFDNHIHNISHRERENHFPYTHTVNFNGSFLKANTFEFKYTVARENSNANIIVTKKFKIIIPRRARGSHDRVQIKLEEIAN